MKAVGDETTLTIKLITIMITRLQPGGPLNPLLSFPGSLPYLSVGFFSCKDGEYLYLQARFEPSHVHKSHVLSTRYLPGTVQKS